MSRRIPLLLTLSLLFVACSGESEPGEVNVEEEVLTYYGAIEAVVNDNCSSCHYPGQGAPIELHTYENVSATAHLLLAYMESGEMPPWTPDPTCREFQHQRVMDPEDIELFRQWIDEGMAEGERPEDHSEFVPTSIAEPDIRAGLIGAPYHPREDVDDEYRCFLLEREFTEDTYVTGTHVETAGADVVHHANIFLVNPHDVDTVEGLEAGSDGPGYPCFGSPGFASISLIGAWVPGAQPILLPEDSAVIIPEGSRLVMQTHFNTLFADVEPVSPEVILYTRDTVPAYRVRGLPFANLNFTIPPGEEESIHVEDYTNASDKPWTVLGVAPHLHSLATRVAVEVIHQDDSESCIIDIPRWDFNWQQAYRFLDDDWVDVGPGDTVRLTCVFDNSPENQPVIDGVRQEPRQVTWGDRTIDEMCMTFLVVIEEYVPREAGELCEEFVECRADCDDPYGIGCIFNCGTIEMDCGVCLIYGAQSCSNRYCPGQLSDALPCLYNCGQSAQTGGDMDGCLTDNCPAERDALEECLRPPIEAGLCNQDIASCNVEF